MLAEKYGARTADTDSLIEKRSGRRIEELIRVEGESRFRELETEVISETLAQGVDYLATGGGALLREESAELLRARGVLVQLAVSAEEAARRLQQGEEQRPLLLSIVREEGVGFVEAARRLMLRRSGLYDIAATCLCTDFVSLEMVAQTLHQKRDLLLLEGKCEIIPAVLGKAQLSQELVFASGGRREVGLRLRQLWPLAEKCALLVDANVLPLWGGEIQQKLEEASFKVLLLKVAAGEESKQLSQLERLAGSLLREGFSRQDIMLVLGGGMLGDLGGLLSSLYMRGMPLVQVPTTLVAQMDAAIGGKTGVNLRGDEGLSGSAAEKHGGKNTLGTFYPAQLVLADVEFLRTLPEREYLSGFAEVVKCALLSSAEFLEDLQANVDKVLARDVVFLQKVVSRCARVKLAHVCADLEDKEGLRACLNFGHTVGHALERFFDYRRFLHGEAVAIGIVEALKIGVQEGHGEQALVEQVRELFRQLKLQTEIPQELRREAFVSSAAEQEFRQTWRALFSGDKKRQLEEIQFVLVSEAGESFLKSISLAKLVDYMALGN